MKELLKEYIPYTQTKLHLIEGIDDQSGRLFAEGKLQEYGAKNGNARVYKKEVLMKEVRRYTDNEITQQRAYGELDHPDTTVVNVKNACWTVEDLWWKGPELYGKLEILVGTPAGDIVAAILKLGKSLGISSRGLGSVKPISENTVEVQDDFELLAFDCVSSPSTYGSFISLSENVDPKNKEQAEKYFQLNKIMTDILRGE